MLSRKALSLTKPKGKTYKTKSLGQGDEKKVSGYGYGLWCAFKWEPHQATSHLRSRLESQHQSVPGCAEECGDPLVQLGGQWQTLGVAAGLGAGQQVQRNPGLASEGMLRLCTLLSLAPSSPDLNPLDYFVWSYVENITNMTSTTPKPTWSPPSDEYSPSSRQRLWKRHAPTSGSVSSRWLRLKAATLDRCQFYYIIKLRELIFFNKSFKIKLKCYFLLDDNFIVPPCRCQLYYIIKLPEFIFSMKVLK